MRHNINPIKTIFIPLIPKITYHFFFQYGSHSNKEGGETARKSSGTPSGSHRFSELKYLTHQPLISQSFMWKLDQKQRIWDWKQSSWELQTGAKPAAPWGILTNHMEEDTVEVSANSAYEGGERPTRGKKKRHLILRARRAGSVFVVD